MLRSDEFRDELVIIDDEPRNSRLAKLASYIVSSRNATPQLRQGQMDCWATEQRYEPACLYGFSPAYLREDAFQMLEHNPFSPGAASPRALQDRSYRAHR